ncbi:endonuclease [Vairimorpha necatrix]|uniref:RNA-directed DNA polymerase n=1 Tax=Vairimorpha necatrix TaxID=6039 RepID=A0AAX4JE57_9MICR
MQFVNKGTFDMATAIKTVGCFSGKKEEDINTWLRDTTFTARVMGLTEDQTARLICLGLRGPALSWIAMGFERVSELDLAEVTKSLKLRFYSSQKTLATLDEFVKPQQFGILEAFIDFCRKGNSLIEQQTMEYKAVSLIVIKKSPSVLKSILYDFARQCQDWSEFLRRTEEVSWIAFPMKSNTTNTDETLDNRTLKVAPSKKGNIPYTIENYKINSCFTNPCYINVEFNCKRHRALIDTGADVSLIPARVLEGTNIRFTRSSTIIRAASGTPLEITGRCLNINFRTENTSITFSPYVTERTPDYIILGVDAIRTNPILLEQLIRKFANTVKKGSLINKVNYISIEEKYHEMFKTEISELTLCNMGKHQIETTVAKAIYQKNGKIPLHFEEEITQQIKKNLQLGVIRNSRSPWNSRVVPVTKPDGSIRLCIDYRELNKITVKDKYPLPRIDEILDDLADATIFSTLDATSGYYQIALEEVDKEKTAFSWRGGHYEFNRMPFGLCNAPATFQRTMDKIFVKENRKFVIPYLDDIIIYSKNHQEHHEHLEIVLGKLKAAGIALNRKKCHFFKEEIKILGNIVTNKTTKPDPEKVKAINEYKEPTNIAQLRSFLGLINYCREFIRNLSAIAAPLYELFKGESKRSVKSISLSKKEKRAFEDLKRLLTEETIRYKINLRKPFILTTDASEQGIGAILSQIGDDGKEHFVSAFSKSLEKAHKNYSTTDKELLAVVKGIENYRHYLLGREFILKTDHKALTYLWEAKNPTSRLLRWAMKLQEYAFQSTYIKGEVNGADGLSRQNPTEKDINIIEATGPSDEDRQKILESYHLDVGHASASTMSFMISQRYKWAGMHKDIKEHVEKCKTCLKSGYPLRNTKNKVIRSERPNQIWVIDLIGRICDTSSQNSFIFIAIDHYSKWVETAVINYKTGSKIMGLIQQLIIEKHGIPERILTDNGLEFINSDIKDLAEKNGIDWQYSSPEHHETVGAVERANQTLMKILNKITDFGRVSWKNKLPEATRCLNLSYNRSIGTSPFMLRENKLPMLSVDKALDKEEVTFSAEETKSKRDENFEKYKKAIVKGKVEVAKKLNVGDKVLIYRETKSGKFKCNWEDGYVITEIILPDAYVVKKNGKVYRLNKTRVKADTSI